MTSLTVLLWHVAICLVDIVIQAISDTLFMPITANNLVQVGANLIVVNNWLMFPFIMAFASFVTVFFYLSVPFVASAVMKGLSGTTATLHAGVQGAMQTAGMMAGAGTDGRGSRGHLWRFRRSCRQPSRNEAAAEELQPQGGSPTTSRARAGLRPGAPASRGVRPDLPNRRGLRPPRLENASRTGPIPPRSPTKRNRIRSP